MALHLTMASSRSVSISPSRPFSHSSLSSLPAPSDSSARTFRLSSAASSSSLSALPMPGHSNRSSAAGPALSSPSSFNPGSFSCPAFGCRQTCVSAELLIKHANSHVDGLFSGSILSNAFDSLGFVSCERCHRFFKTSGLATHRRACLKRTLIVDDRVLIDALHDSEELLPSLEEVFAVNVPTIASVPTGCQQVWGTVLERELFNVAMKNTAEAWTRLLMLPKCVLVASRRAGKRNRGDHLSVSYLCEAWTRGELMWLWTRALRGQPTSKKGSSGVDSKRVFEAAVTHVRHGRLGKACSALSSSGLAPDNEETREKLESKHPVCDVPPPVLDINKDSPAVQLNSLFDLRGLLSSFAKDVGTDGTNFRVQHLVDGSNAHLPRSVISSLRSVINLLLSGAAHADTRPFLAGAKLTALVKGESDIRPIAAGNVFRRIASKCVCQLNQARFRAALGKLQAGVACPAGAELVVHSTRDIVSRHWRDDFVLLKVDFANAFNSIDRHTLLLQCQSLFPDLLPWVRWCYGEQPWLVHRTGNLRSCVGVQQGDPLGPFLFCLVLQILAARVADASPGLVLHKWYLDDGVIAGPVSDVLRALSILSLDGPALGLHLNLAKCELFSPDMNTFDCEFSFARGTFRFPDDLHRRSDVPNFLLLGAPFGDADFCSSYIQQLCEANRVLLGRIAKLEDPQVSLHLTRTCASFGKFVYVARTTPPVLIQEALTACDDDVRESLASFAALQLSDTAWSQAQLPLSRGGLGLRSVSEHCAAAYISSHIRALPDVITVDLTAALGLFAFQARRALDVGDVDALMATPPTQRSLSRQLDKLRSDSLFDDSPTLVDRVRLLACMASRSSAWLAAMPCKGPLDLTLTPDQMQAALQHRLGLSLADSGELCSLCGKELDVAGHHHLTCSHGNFVNSRHNQLRDKLFALCAAAGMSPSKEEGGYDRDRTRPADVLVPSWRLGKSAAFDLTVVSPLTQKHLSRAGDHDNEPVECAASVKHEENDPKCAALGWLCVPLAVDSYGQWCVEAHEAFAEIASRLSTRTRVTFSRSLSSIFNTLGVVLARHNAIAVLARRAHPFSIGAREVLSASSLFR